jgi:geranylgeranyl diphosphate synthase type I
MTVLRYKSAKYSIERPLHIGAALAGRDAGRCGELTAYGLPLGEAFQLRDDLLGVYGDPRRPASPPATTWVEGKRTVLVALALDGAPAATPPASTPRSAPPLSADDRRRAAPIIDASGAHTHVEQVIDDLVELSLTKLDASSFAEPAPAGPARAGLGRDGPRRLGRSGSALAASEPPGQSCDGPRRRRGRRRGGRPRTGRRARR